MTPETPTPDYDEPWKMEAYNSPLGESGDFEGVIEIRTRDEIRRAEVYNPDDEDEDAFKRIIQCVNACAGMADPASEIKAMREVIIEASEALKELRSFYLDMTGLPPCAANAAIAKLRSFQAGQNAHAGLDGGPGRA